MRKNIPALLCLLTFYAVLPSCSKPSTLGLDIIGGNGLDYEVTDTSSVVMSVVEGDTIITSGIDFTRYFVGNYQDNSFGKTSAASFFNFYLERVNPDFSNSTLDSMVLVLPYDTIGHYGNTTQPQTWDVLRVAEDLDKNTTYYSNKSFQTSDILASGFTFTPKPTTSVVVRDTAGASKTLTPHIRIPLSQTLGQEFLNAPTGTYSSLNSFKSFFKGVQLVSSASNSANGLIRLNLYSSDSKRERAKIELYYTQSGKKKVFKFEYNPNQPNVAIGRYIHDYTGATTFDTGTNDTLSFAKGLGGCMVKVALPGASSANFDNIVVNKAELIVNAPILRDQGLTPDAARISVLYRKTDGKLALTNDFSLLSYLSYSGGNRESVVSGRGISFRYRFNLSHHFQKMADGLVPENVVYLKVDWVSNPMAIGNEVATTAILANQRSVSNKPKLVLTYSKF